jgi:hypothetical protein
LIGFWWKKLAHFVRDEGAAINRRPNQCDLSRWIEWNRPFHGAPGAKPKPAGGIAFLRLACTNLLQFLLFCELIQTAVVMKVLAAVFLLLLGTTTTIHAQSQMRVLGTGETVPGEIIANVKENKDANNRLAALLIIETDLSGLAFEVDAVRQEPKPGQYLLFLSPGERKVRVLSSNHVPLDIILSEFGVRLKSGDVWRLKITGDKKIETIPVNLISIPADARKMIDGKDEGTGSVFRLGLGKHRVRLEKAGFAPLEQEIEVTTSKSLFNFTLKEVELLSVTLRSEPAGATIFVDGIEKGQTPKGFFQYPGRYNVSWALSGYVAVEQQIEVKEGEKNEYSVKLEKNTGVISWVIEPSNATVSINKEDYTLRESAELAPGKYLLEFSAGGYDPKSETIELERGENLRKTYKLVQQTGGLQFSVEPVDADVELLRNGQTIKRWKGFEIINDLPVGDYVIKINADGYRTQRKKVGITIGQKEKVSISLEKGSDKRPWMEDNGSHYSIKNWENPNVSKYAILPYFTVGSIGLDAVTNYTLPANGNYSAARFETHSQSHDFYEIGVESIMFHTVGPLRGNAIFNGIRLYYGSSSPSEDKYEMSNNFHTDENTQWEQYHETSKIASKIHLSYLGVDYTISKLLEMQDDPYYSVYIGASVGFKKYINCGFGSNELFVPGTGNALKLGLHFSLQEFEISPSLQIGPTMNRSQIIPISKTSQEGWIIEHMPINQRHFLVTFRWALPRAIIFNYAGISDNALGLKIN